MSRIPIKKGEVLKIYTDGAARGNPGPAAYAFLFVHNDTIIQQGSQLCQKYEKVEFFHVSRNDRFIQKCDELCNSQLDKEGLK